MLLPLDAVPGRSRSASFGRSVGPIPSGHRGARGMPRPTIAMMSRSDLVGASAEGEDRLAPRIALEPSPEHRTRRALDQGSGRPDDLEEQAVGLECELAAEDLGRGGISGVEAARRGPCNLPIEELEKIGPYGEASQLHLHPLPVDDPPAIGALLVPRPGGDLGDAPEDPRDGADRHSLVVELVGDELPSLVLLTDQVFGRYPDVVVIGGTREFAGHCRQGRPAEALRGGGHDEHREALVPRGVRIGPRCEPDVVGVLDRTRVELHSVDDVLVAVADCAGLERGEIGSRRGLGVPDREVDLPTQDPRKEALLLLGGTEGHQCRAHAVEREQRERDTGPMRLLDEDHLVDRSARLAAVLDRPAEAQPAVLPHSPHVTEVLRLHLRSALDVVDQVDEVPAQLLLEAHLLVGECEVHDRYRRAP